MNHYIKIERLYRSLFLQNFISSVKFLEFSFEYFPRYVYSFFLANNLVQHKGNVFKANINPCEKECNLYFPLPNCKRIESLVRDILFCSNRID